MSLMTRALAITAAVLGALVLAASIALWAFFSSWLPVQGKAKLIQELEHRFPVEVSIASLRYDVFKGFVFEGVEVRNGLGQEVQAQLSSGQVRVNWLALATKRVIFRGRAAIEQPARATVSLAGHYHLGQHTLYLDVATTELALSSLGPSLRRLLPRQLVDGVVRGRAHIRPSGHALPIVVGRIDGAGLVWAAEPWRLKADARLDGTASPPEDPSGRWTVKADFALERGTLDGPSFGGPALAMTGIAGRGRIDDAALAITELTGELDGSPWRIEAHADLARPMAIDAGLTASLKLATLRRAFPALAPGWEPDGQAEVRAACHGREWDLRSADCQAQAQLRNAVLAGERLATPLTDLSGLVRYDTLAKRLTLEPFRARLGRQRLEVSGDARLTTPPVVTLRIVGAVPLAALLPWLPKDAPVRKLDGLVEADLTIAGPANALEYDGTVEFQDAAAVVTRPSATIERLNGPVHFARDRVETPQLAMVLNRQPLTMAFKLDGLDAPRVTGLILFPLGQLELAGRLTPREAHIDEARLRLPGSDVRVSGLLSRTGGPSRLSVSGAVSFEDLRALPFAPQAWVESWKLQGRAEVDATFEGLLTDVAGATVRAAVRAPSLSVQGVPAQAVEAAVEQVNRRFQLRIPAGTIAGGRLWGDLRMAYRATAPEFALETDINRLQLAQLGEAIPAWRTRQVSGLASAHARVSGTWGRRATWQGEGWLDAQGERLGRVPLLDRVFQGLFGVLGDRLGLDTLRRAEIREASMKWQLTKERVWTDSLRLAGTAGTEPVAVYGKGSVGLDHTVDLVVEPELSEGTIVEAPTTASLAGALLKAAGQLEHLRRLIGRHRITGTLKQPQYRFEYSTQEVFRQLTPDPAGLLQGFLDAVRR